MFSLKTICSPTFTTKLILSTTRVKCHTGWQSSNILVARFHRSPVSQKSKYMPKARQKPKVQRNRYVGIWKNMTVNELAKAMNTSLENVFDTMVYVEDAEQFETPNSVIWNPKVITGVLKRHGFSGEWAVEEDDKAIKDALPRPPADPQTLVKRPPVVTIMGHVDHGKTTLLDSLRNTSVVKSEFGGITQHIGAFLVRLPSGDTVSFLDTPGHAAFMAMRARGANVTDIVVLVVAADDGVMEQTVECIRLANEANVPIIVAINKIDKPRASIELCKKGLLMNGIQLEDSGGDVQSVPISALEGINLDTLIEAIITQAELMELKADPKGLVEGHVVESRTDPHRGKLSTAIVKRGTLRKGAFLVAGLAWAKVRNLFDDKGKTMESAPPSTPVEIVGWKELPSAGEQILEVESEKRAHEVIQVRTQIEKAKKMEDDRVIIEKKAAEHSVIYQERQLKKQTEGRLKLKREGPREKEIKDDSKPRLAVIIKGDVDGSVEAILDVLVTYHSMECPMDIIRYGVGMVSENDVELCKTFNGIIYSFNIGILSSAKNIAESSGVEVKNFNVIYHLVNDVRDEINRRLPPIDQDEIIGEANVVQEFLISEGRNKVPVAGCRCTSGQLKKSALFKLIRNEDLLHEGTLASMRHEKTEVDTINKDVECGLRMADVTVRVQPGDTIVCYRKIKVPQMTNWDPGF